MGEHGRAGARPRQARSPGRRRADARAADPHPRRRRVRRAGDHRRGAQHVGAGRLQRRRDRPHRGQQPGRVHHLADLRQVDHLRDRRRDDAADPDLPRQRRGSGGGLPGGRSGGRLPAAVPPRRAHRALVLPQARTQRRGRAVVHAAGDVPDHRLEAVDPDGLPGLRRRSPRAGRRTAHHRRGDRRHRRRQATGARRGARDREQAGDAAASEHLRRRLGAPQGRGRQQGPRGADRGDARGDQGGDARAHHHAARLSRSPQAAEADHRGARPDGRRREAARLGDGRGARVRDVAGAGDAGAPLGAGLAPRDLQPPPRRHVRPRGRARLHAARRTSAPSRGCSRCSTAR